MNLIDKAVKFTNGAKILADWIGSGGITVEQELAQKRADICMGCPKHDQHYSFAETVAGVIKQQLELKSHLQLRVQGEKSLHVCGVCACCLKLKIWLPLSRVKPEESEMAQYPDNCWLLTEQQPTQPQ